MSSADWLVDTRVSYDTVAASYADIMSDVLACKPLVRGVLALFAEVVRAVGGPVADVGCGPGHVAAHLRALGVDVLGVDLSPAMIAIARRDHPEVPFWVGSMTDLDLGDRSVGGVLAFYSVIHVADEDVPGVFAHFHRALRPGGVVMLGFHVGDSDRLKTSGYGGHAMKVHVYLRPMERMVAWLCEAGFAVDAQVLLNPDADVPGGVLLARRP